MTVNEIACQFKIGDKVRCKINVGIESREWFVGEILEIKKEHHKEYALIIKRDNFINDFQLSWLATINEHTKHLIFPLVGDWDL